MLLNYYNPEFDLQPGQTELATRWSSQTIMCIQCSQDEVLLDGKAQILQSTANTTQLILLSGHNPADDGSLRMDNKNKRDESPGLEQI